MDQISITFKSTYHLKSKGSFSVKTIFQIIEPLNKVLIPTSLVIQQFSFKFILKSLKFIINFTLYLFMPKNKQNEGYKQIVDHHYVNNIYCGVLSTLESLKLISQNKHKQMYRHKLFNSYDKIDYSMKNMLELQSQLQTHLIIFKASLQGYTQQYKKQWIPPSNFDNQNACSFISAALNVFNQNNDEISSRLTKDFLDILRGSTQNLYIDQVSIKGSYSPVQKLENRKTLMINSMRAKEIMDEERTKIEEQKVQNIGSLRANLNLNYYSSIYYKYMVVSKKYYQQNLRDNVGFQLSLIDENEIYNNKQQAFKRKRRLKDRSLQKELLIELQICNNSVFKIQVVE